METSYKGIDYSFGQVNFDKSTGIHFGVIPMHSVCQAWCDDSEGYYGKPEASECPHCPERDTVDVQVENWGDTATCEVCHTEWEVELPDYAEPISHFIDDGEYKAEQSQDSCDIFVMRSPYYTHAQFCSPCAPGACYLLNPCDSGEKAYCFGHDWFENGLAPYPVFNVATGALILPSVVSRLI